MLRNLLNTVIAGVLAFTVANAQNKKIKGEDYVITISTEFGDMVILLFDQTPKHKENFIKLAGEGYFDGTTFHRIIKNFMIQGGDPNSKDEDPNNDGHGGPGYTIPAEFVPELKHIKGALAAARMGDAVNPNKESSGSQFYIVQNNEGTHFLNNNYTVFGQVIKGLDVVDKIAEQPKDGRDRPLKNITMKVKAEKMKKKKIIKLYGCENMFS
ncbi:MAG: peptidylprolyl isomerase [Cytophagaceae bacterium]